MSKNSEYASKYAPEACEQMKRYGIPASVILAQAILESSNGQSQLARNENNHFGIKATQSWISNGGKYGLYTDDKPNEKFCSYASVGDSYEHHSQFLKNSTRYKGCFSLSADDYKGWTKGIEKAGYATGGGYAANLQKIIEVNGLQKYDKEVMAEMQSQVKSFGVEQNKRSTYRYSGNTQISGIVDTNSSKTINTNISNDYSFPLKRDEFLFITSPFGMRNDPMDKSKEQMHKGIDIRTDHEAVLATEKSGKVIAVNQNANTAGGKSLTVEYQREDKSKVQVTYIHLDSIDIKVGDEVIAGQKLGISGNTGTRTTGEHLHLGVKARTSEGASRDVDPAAYLAEIAQKGNIQLQALHNGNDLLAKYKSDIKPEQETNLSPDDWMKKLLSSEDSGTGLSTGDPIMEKAISMFMSLLPLALMIDNKSDEEKKESISQSVNGKQVDLKSLLPSLKECKLSVDTDGKALLTADNGTTKVSRELTNAEMSRLSLILGNTELTDEAKRLRISGMVNTLVLSQQASQNYEEAVSQLEGQQQNMQRK